MKPKNPTQYQRKATPVTHVFRIDGSITQVNWPSWAVRPGKLRYDEGMRGWVVHGSPIEHGYRHSSDTRNKEDLGRTLRQTDYLVLENDQLAAYDSDAFGRLFEPVTQDLFRRKSVEDEIAGEDDIPSHYDRDDERTLCCLLLTGQGAGATLAAIAGWTHGQCVDAENWALAEHLHASDNPHIKRLPIPAHVAALPPPEGDEITLI